MYLPLPLFPCLTSLTSPRFAVMVPSLGYLGESSSSSPASLGSQVSKQEKRSQAQDGLGMLCLPQGFSPEAKTESSQRLSRLGSLAYA